MWSKRKKASGLRFCITATELPYDDLFEYREFTLAVSKLSQFRWFSANASRPEPSAVGLVHRTDIIYGDGREKPLLPFTLNFDTAPVLEKSSDSHLGGGFCDRFEWDRSRETKYTAAFPHYFLKLNLADPGGAIFDAFAAAFERGVISGYSYVHLRCIKSDATYAPVKAARGQMGDSSACLNARRELLQQIEQGKGTLPSVVFDHVAFDDNCLSKAPIWSWQWEGDDVADDVTGSMYQSKAVAKYRKSQG